MQNPAQPENAAEFAWRHDDVFGRIASRYDLLCDVFSLGIPVPGHRCDPHRAQTGNGQLIRKGNSQAAEANVEKKDWFGSVQGW